MPLSANWDQLKNREIAKIFRNIALLLEIRGDMVFKIRAYERAAQLLETLDEDIEAVYARNGLNDLPGVGEKLAEKIEQYLKEGKINHYEKLKKTIPVDIEELDRVQGLGPKTIMKLYKLLNVKNIQDLEKAAKEKKISKIKRLGPQVEKNILKSIAFAKDSTRRTLLGAALPLAESIKKELSSLKEVKQIEIAGSLRRKKDTIGDIDLLASSKNVKTVMDAFVNLEGVDKILAKGATKSSIRKDGMQIDLRVVKESEFGAALLHFTGSKDHNIAIRKIALKKGMKVSEYGIFDKKTNEVLASKTEKECYKKLGLTFIEPEMREDNGEIDLAGKNKLPKLLTLEDIKGDVHMHSDWSDGNNTILEMAKAAEKLGYSYIAITDHVGKAGLGNAMDEKFLPKQKAEIDEANKKTKITILHGAEVNIQANGSIDVDKKYLKELDLVIASIHFGFKNSKETLTKRLLKAMENEHVNIIGHPTGRLINIRPGYELDFDEVFDKAKITKTAFEINALPKRLDLNDVNVHHAITKGVKIAIGSDSHSTQALHNLPFAVYTAKRGWAEKKDVMNTVSIEKLRKELN